jgi:hypothetical protein
VRCAELDALLSRLPACEETEFGTRTRTDCLYPSSDPVWVYVARRAEGYRVSDGGGAVRSALNHGAAGLSFFEKACKRYSVEHHGNELVAEPKSDEWLYPAIVAVSNASAMAARQALEAVAARSESGLKLAIYEHLKRTVPPASLASNYEYRGRSGHIWPIDFAVLRSELVLIKSVVQNGNSINSNYATFGDIGDAEPVRKFSVFDQELAPDSAALLHQVATLVPLQSLSAATQRLH